MNTLSHWTCEGDLDRALKQKRAKGVSIPELVSKNISWKWSLNLIPAVDEAKNTALLLSQGLNGGMQICWTRSIQQNVKSESICYLTHGFVKKQTLNFFVLTKQLLENFPYPFYK